MGADRVCETRGRRHSPVWQKRCHRNRSYRYDRPNVSNRPSIGSTHFRPRNMNRPRKAGRSAFRTRYQISDSETFRRPRRKPTPVGRYIGIGVTILAVIFLSIIVGLILFLSLGPVAAVIAAVVAFTPAMIYLLPFMFLDRYDPEPLWLLALAFGWGALVAVLVSIVVNTLITIIVAVIASIGGLPPELGELAGAVFSAPIFEEGSKGVGLLILLIFFRRYFDDILDGIVFAGVIALRFRDRRKCSLLRSGTFRGRVRRFGSAVLYARHTFAVRACHLYVNDGYRLRHRTGIAQNLCSHRDACRWLHGCRQPSHVVECDGLSWCDIHSRTGI